jgi:hypothetical protein
VRQVGYLVVDPLANSMALDIIKPSVTFQQGDTFVFGSWVCIADGAGSFLRYLASTSESKLKSSMLTQASMEEFIKNFGEISLSDLVKELELESEYNSTSPTIQAESPSLVAESALNLDSLPTPPIFGHRHVITAYQAALKLLMCPSSKIVLEYSSDSEVHLNCFDSDSFEFVFDYGSDSTEAQQLSGPVLVFLNFTTSGASSVSL